MIFDKEREWKIAWGLFSIKEEALFDIVASVIARQLEDVEKKDIKYEANLVTDYDADSVDIVAMLVCLEEVFKDSAPNSSYQVVVPTDKLSEIVTVEDLFHVIYEVVYYLENNMEEYVPLKPNYEALKKQKTVGELYPNKEKEKEKNEEL